MEKKTNDSTPLQLSPMQELREKLQIVVNDLNDATPGTDQYGYRGAMENVIKDIDAQLLSKESSYLQQARAEAVDFAEWILKESVLPRDTVWFDAGKHFTSQELYAQYLNQFTEPKI